MAADTNNVIEVGRLTRDAELKFTQAGFAIGNLSIAVNDRVKKGDQWVDEASFFDVTHLGKGAEALKPYLLKGTQICVTGKLKQDRWQDQSGQNRSKIYILAEHIQLLGKAPERSDGGGYQQRQSAPQAPYSKNNPEGLGRDSEEGNSAGFDDDIPF